MTKGGYQIEKITMASSANDVWGAIFAATSIFPMFLPDLYEKIEPSRRDGYIQGSLRKITYGPGFRVVKTSIEEMTRVDHGEMTVCCTVVSGEFVSRHFRSFDTTTAVAPFEGRHPGDAGCTVTWSCAHTDESGSLSTDAVIELAKKTLAGVDAHLIELRKSIRHDS